VIDCAIGPKAGEYVLGFAFRSAGGDEHAAEGGGVLLAKLRKGGGVLAEAVLREIEIDAVIALDHGVYQQEE
jgi:hypothetical protein